MGLLQLAASLGLFWSLIHFAFVALRNHKPDVYCDLTGAEPHTRSTAPLTTPPQTPRHRIEHSFGFIRYTTSAYNAHFQSASIKRPKTWQIWFSIGAYFGLFALISSIIMLVIAAQRFADGLRSQAGNDALTNVTEWSALQYDFRSNSTFRLSTGPAMGMDGGKQFLVSMIPGVNLPLSAIGYYFATLFFSGVVHEVGHALAAACAHVPIHSFGIFLYALYPGAFVTLHTETLALLPAFTRLRIISAGVWHNIVVALLSYLLLCTLPIWTLWGYRQPATGVVVLDVLDHSPLYGHLVKGDVVTRIDGRAIEGGLKGWENALYNSLVDTESVHTGYCVPKQFHDRPLSCCNVTTENPLGDPTNPDQCFHLKDPPPPSSNTTTPLKTCIPFYTASTYPHCTTQSDCSESQPQSTCMTPYIPNPFIRTLKIHFTTTSHRAQQQSSSEPVERTVTFLGDPREVWEAGSLLPHTPLLPISLPYIFERFLNYLLSFSLALAFLNMVPAHGLDGHHALFCIADILFRSTTALDMKIERRKKRFVNIVTWSADVLLGGVMVVGVVNAVWMAE